MDLDDVQREYPGVKDLTKRSFDLLIMNGVKFPETVRRIIDVSQSAGRARATMSDMLPCVTPKMAVYMTDRCRLITGQEALRSQGLSWGVERDARLMGFTNELLLDLAGNAFHSGCCAAMLLSMFATVGVASARAAGTRVHALRPSALFRGATLIDDDNSDDDLDNIW